MDWTNVICPKCGLINDYTITEKSGQQVCRCNGCNFFLGNKPKEYYGTSNMIMPFGKYANIPIKEIEDVRYLEWLIENTKLSGVLHASIIDRINILNNL